MQLGDPRPSDQPLWYKLDVLVGQPPTERISYVNHDVNHTEPLSKFLRCPLNVRIFGTSKSWDPTFRG